MIKTNSVEAGAIVEFIVEGNCSLEELLDIVRSQYCNIPKGVLWNLTNGSIANLQGDDMSIIAMEVKEHAKHMKSALVGSSDIEFGLLRMYETHAEMKSVPHVIKVFRDRSDAIQWINEIA